MSQLINIILKRNLCLSDIHMLSSHKIANNLMEERKTGKSLTSFWNHRRQPKMLYGKMLYITKLTISLSHCTSLTHRKEIGYAKEI